MKIIVIGTGYVGLVTGTCLARFGNNVICVDTNRERVETLRRGEVPFYEPGLAEMLQRNSEEGRLSFTSDTEEALSSGADICFITVGTPSDTDGSADLSYVEAAARSVGRVAETSLLVVLKSTVPVGTNLKLKGWLSDELKKRNIDSSFTTASNPEFLREGAALRDFLEPDRVIVGTDSSDAVNLMSELYAFLEPSRLLFMDIPSAEMAKYASNAMLATRISFMNEMSNICERVGADVENVRRGMAADSRIGSKFLYAGCGYGGSCFPKDVRALRNFAVSAGYTPEILNAVEDVNEHQKEVMYKKLKEHFGNLEGKTVAVWGLAFKPKTSDTREAPAQKLILSLLDAGAYVQAHDPRAIEETRLAIGERQGIVYVHNQYDAVNGADALVLVTEWDIYLQPDFERIKKLLSQKVILDGRNIYSPTDMKRRGFTYLSIGRQSVFCEKG